MEVDPSSSPSSSRPPHPPPLAATPSFFDPESYGRYRKRLSSSNVSPLLGGSHSRSSGPRLLYDGESIPRWHNAGLLLEDIKQEAADYSNMESMDGSRMFSSVKRASLDGGSASDTAYSLGRQAGRQTLKPVKLEEDMYVPDVSLILQSKEVKPCYVRAGRIQLLTQNFNLMFSSTTRCSVTLIYLCMALVWIS